MKQSTVVRYSGKLLEEYAGKSILVDTSALIEAGFPGAFLEFMRLLANETTLCTIPDVIHEFSRAFKDKRQYEDKKFLVKELGISVLSKQGLPATSEEYDEFFFAYYTAMGYKKHLPSCTDYNLCLKVFENQGNLYLLSGNHSDIPTSIFDRDDLITIDKGRELHIEAIYSFDKKKYEKYLRLIDK